MELGSSPASNTTAPTAASGSRIGRPPQWTVSRSRKLARLYLFSTLSIEKIIKVLEEDGFSPRKNSAQKTIHKMLDNDPRYLRPESRAEMSKRFNSLATSTTRRKRKGASGRGPNHIQDSKRVSTTREPPACVSADCCFYRKQEGSMLSRSELTSPSGQSIKSEEGPSFDFTTSPDVASLNCFTFPNTVSRDTTEAGDEEWQAGIRGIKRRVSDCSTHFAFQLSSLIKEFTISICSDNKSTGRRPSAAGSEDLKIAEEPEPEVSTEPHEAFPDPGFALPGDFLTAHTRSCADFPGQQHGKGRCWCSITKDTCSDGNSWLLPNGRLSPRAQRILEQPLPGDVNLFDSFGNTPLHLFAALEGYQDALLMMVANYEGRGLETVNTAGQTFLHVLNLEWFTDLSSPSPRIRRLLGYVSDMRPDVLYKADVYGRTFFHRAHSVLRDPSTLASLVSLFDPTLTSSRDAFGFNPVPDADSRTQSPYIPPRRVGSVSPQVEDLARGNANGSRPQSSSSQGSVLAYHARLVQIIHSSYTNPTVEDADGRNGLHCLAEAILNQQAMDRHVRSSSSALASPNSRPHLKRKLDSKEPSAPPSPTPGNTSSMAAPSSSPPSMSSTTAEGTLPARLRHLHSLLHPSGVSVTHYDTHGLTPLMAFVEHIPDDQDDKAKTLQAILETLVRAGARLEARNRRGETPLLMAARLGRKVALAALLECGANVHARDADGRGVLELLDGEVGGEKARKEVGLYARLEACRVLLTGRREWGVGYVGGNAGREGGYREPAVVREWRVRDGVQGGMV
ncbi:uncharacterized protein C8A04DRAFT_13625 [Dichotomopilus funicola]|uniref:Ankyrin n=1 Tax=Dichotomopilus funicola TaxID=1934379 RepID=A0AAN6V1X5_9PEZI|nr:hypothetical protein C8A04DRAFT_13625 [Dichotomopilus funicola]